VADVGSLLILAFAHSIVAVGIAAIVQLVT